MLALALHNLLGRPGDPWSYEAPEGIVASCEGPAPDETIPGLPAEDWLRLFWHVGVGTLTRPLARILGLREAPLGELLDDPELHDLIDTVELVPQDDDGVGARTGRHTPGTPTPDLAEARLDLRERLRAHARDAIHRATTGAGRNLRVVVWCRWVRLVHRTDPVEHLLDDLIANLDRPRPRRDTARGPAKDTATRQTADTTAADAPAAAEAATPIDPATGWGPDWFTVPQGVRPADAADAPSMGAEAGPAKDPDATANDTVSDPANDPRLLRARLARFANRVSRDLRRRLIEDFFEHHLAPTEVHQLGIEIPHHELEPVPRRKPAERWSEALTRLAATMPPEPEPPPTDSPGPSLAPQPSHSGEPPAPPVLARPELHPRTRPPD
ncbi:MAG: hypothetical protein KDE35_00045 [Geminicoccaceae bacterium]|nr:hypothetical protein [Geminicoccaceae bacterium]